MNFDGWLKTLLGCVLIVLLICACSAFILIGYGLTHR